MREAVTPLFEYRSPHGPRLNPSILSLSEQIRKSQQSLERVERAFRIHARQRYPLLITSAMATRPGPTAPTAPLYVVGTKGRSEMLISCVLFDIYRATSVGVQIIGK